MIRDSKRNKKYSSQTVRLRGNRSEPTGGRDPDSDDPSALLDAAVADATRHYQRQDKLHALWERSAGSSGASVGEESAGKSRPSEKPVMDPAVVKERLRLLHKLRERYCRPNGRIQWKDFLKRHPSESRQNMRELHHAEKILGEKVLSEALTKLGHAKAIHLSRVPGIKRKTATRLLKVGIDLYGTGTLRSLTEVRDADLRVYIRRKSRKTVGQHARRRHTWPDALLSHVRELVLAWRHIQRRARSKAATDKARRAPKTLVHRVITARLVLDQAVEELDRWLAARTDSVSNNDGSGRVSRTGRRRTV